MTSPPSNVLILQLFISTFDQLINDELFSESDYTDAIEVLRLRWLKKKETGRSQLEGNQSTVEKKTRATGGKHGQIHPVLAPIEIPAGEEDETKTTKQVKPKGGVGRRRSLAPGIEQKMVQEALHRDTFNKGNKQGFNGEDTQKYKRVAIAVVEPFVIDTRSTFGRLVLGKAISQFLFAIMKGIHGMICWGMMIVAIVIACPTFCGLLPYECSYVMFLMVPTLASYSSILNLQLLRHLLKNFDVLLLIMYTWSAQLSLVLCLRDARIWTCVIGTWGMTYMILVDASPDKVRKSVGHSGCVGVFIFTFAVVCALWFGAVPDLHPRHIDVGDTKYSSSSISIISGMNCCLFFANQIYQSFAHPHFFAILTSKMKSVKVIDKSAAILTTLGEKLSISEPRSRRESSFTPKAISNLTRKFNSQSGSGSRSRSGSRSESKNSSSAVLNSNSESEGGWAKFIN
ncbi:hypothetical protein TrLO_g12513 [Triparma laevis f. longispina]|uniref:Uncharacterized protein n=1 Tax=Triparma laevis f. longispina TaxID=1714387 RepID=A0A9W7KWV2_9STRA|nr:hypothetical protein TrLO_g12513 [Triparma laevis f. longispina]